MQIVVNSVNCGLWAGVRQALAVATYNLYLVSAYQVFVAKLDRLLQDSCLIHTPQLFIIGHAIILIVSSITSCVNHFNRA